MTPCPLCILISKGYAIPKDHRKEDWNELSRNELWRKALEESGVRLLKSTQ